MKISTKTIVTVGMFTAVLSVLSILTIPMPSGVPVTLQTFAMALCGYVLGWKMGTASTLIYILLGTVGVPVFAGMTGGPSWLVGYSGGFIWGFIFLTLLCGMGIRQKNVVLRTLLGIAGLAICHLLGVIQFSLVASTTIPASFVTVSVPYIVKDVISVIGAELVAVPVRKALVGGNILAEKPRMAQ
jgi:biotin transport system substrate-specific component